MKFFAPAIGLLLLSATVATPASANWFSGSTGHSSMWNIGSVRNPTPQELRFFYAKQLAQQAAAGQLKTDKK
jgi:hypothetical protein